MADENDKDVRLGGKRKKKALPPVSEKPESHPANALFNLFIIAFIGYGFYIYMQKGGDAGVLNELGEQLAVIDAPQEGDPRIDRLHHQQRSNALARMFPLTRPAVTHQVLEEGKGAPASCGQLATYRLISGFGKTQQVSEAKQLRLGSTQAPQGLTLGIEGMRPGETRRIMVPQELWTGVRPQEGQVSEVTAIVVTLEALEPELPQAEMPLRRFVIRGGSGYPLRCGDLAMMHLTLWGADGTQLFTSKGGKPVYFFLGEGQVPYGLERGVLEMAPGGLYSLVSAAELWKPLAVSAQEATLTPPFAVQAFPQDLSLPEGQIILVDIDYPKDAPRRLPVTKSPVTQPLETNQPVE